MDDYSFTAIVINNSKVVKLGMKALHVFSVVIAILSELRSPKGSYGSYDRRRGVTPSSILIHVRDERSKLNKYGVD